MGLSSFNKLRRMRMQVEVEKKPEYPKQEEVGENSSDAEGVLTKEQEVKGIGEEMQTQEAEADGTETELEDDGPPKEQNDAEGEYKDKSAKQLYKMCKDADIECKPKKSRGYYISLLNENE